MSQRTQYPCPQTPSRLLSTTSPDQPSRQPGLNCWRYLIVCLALGLFLSACTTTSKNTASAGHDSPVTAAPAAPAAPATSGSNSPTPAPVAATPASPAEAAVPDLQSTLGASYRLQEGDTINIKFDATTNMNAVAKLQLDGAITMPMIGEVKIIGKTTSEVRAQLMKQYETLLKGEDITVSILSVTSCVYLSGAVLRPGRVAMDRPLSLLQGIMEAGGFDHNRAKISNVTVIRVENGKQQIFKIDMRRVMNGKTIDVFYLKPFDTVHVPERTFNL